MNMRKTFVFILVASCLWNTGRADFNVETTASEATGLPTGSRSVQIVSDRGKSPPSLTIDNQSFILGQRLAHANGDVTWGDPAGRILLTESKGAKGVGGLFGSIRSNRGEYWVTSDAMGTWAVPVDHVADRNSCGTVHNGEALPIKAEAKGSDTFIDVLIIYTRALAERYPGNLLETRLNQYMAVANLGFANSGLAIRARLVGFNEVEYSNTTPNRDALFAMSDTLAGMPQTGLENLPNLRSQTGADLVIMIRPHDIERRGNCGIAFYPDGTPQRGVNVVSDGMSSWSLCTDQTLIHEIGHNLGAAHQIGAGGGDYDVRGSALVNDVHFQTIMGSAGTGRLVRNRELLLFSNPQVQCGGAACGRPASAEGPIDNSAVLRDTVPFVSAYQLAVSNLAVPEITPGLGDADGDGVSSDLDAFPFDPEETMDTDGDNVGDVADRFPNNPTEQFDTDGDGIGDFADTDDDNDGVIDGSDAFRLDATEQSNSDFDRVGDSKDFATTDPSEWRDSDGDGVGDNADLDADNDGWNDFHPSRQDLLVVSVGNNRVLRFDARTGQPRGIEVPPGDGLVTFQSDVAYSSEFDQVFVTTSSSVVRFDPHSRLRDSIYVPAYAEHGGVVELGSGFPTAIDFNAFDELEVVVQGRGIRAWGFDRPVFIAEDVSPSDDFMPTEVAQIVGELAIAAVDWQSKKLLPRPFVEPIENPGFGEVRGLTHFGNQLLMTDRSLSRVWSYQLSDDPLLPTDEFSVFAYMLETREPYGIGVTANDKVLVSDAAGNEIIEFNADGSFSRVLVAQGAGGLDQPGRMAIVPAILDRFPTDPTRAIRPNAGLWFNPETTGRGLDVQIFGNRLSVIWYTFDDQGLPTWYFSSGELDGFTYQSTFDRVSLSAEGDVIIEPVGTVQIAFTDERVASFSWSVGDAQGQEPIQWLAFDDDVAAPDATGLWGRADGPGWGLSVVSQGVQSVAVAYVFDDAGMPRWVISDPTNLGTGTRFPVNQVVAPHLCPTCSGDDALVITAAGTLDFDSVGATWSSQITFSDPVSGEWQEDVEVVRFSDIPVRPR